VTMSTSAQDLPQPTSAVSSQRHDPARPKAGIKFEIVAGAHQGAVLTLDGTNYRIGSSPNADIVLSDAGIAPEHAVLRVDRGSVSVGATGGNITVDRESLPLSRGCRVNLPVSITVGAAQIHLSDPDQIIQSPGPFRQLLTTAGVTVCAALAIAIAAQEWRGAAGLSPVAVTVGSADAGAAEPSPPQQELSAANAPNPSGPTAEDAMGALNTRLDGSKIRSLHISAENGRLVATGTLTKQEAAEWAAIQQWFDQTYGGRFVLTTRIEPPSSARALPALQLQSIYYGEPRPYIMTADGEHYFKGAVLDNGWILRDITEDRVLLGKDGETAALTYR
jgi:hypothetical protein